MVNHFIYKYLPEYLDHLSSYENIGSIIIYTNGTILPSTDLINSLKHSNSIVEISNYGNASRHAFELKDLLSNHQIPSTLKDPVWTDSGRIHTHKNRESTRIVRKVFSMLHQ